MNVEIWKYDVQIDDNTWEVEIPADAKFLDVQIQGTMQGKGPVMWWLVNTESEKKKYRFQVWGTGHPHKWPKYGKSRFYLGTFQLDGFVGHLIQLAHWPVPV